MFHTALLLPRSSRPIRDQTWLALYSCNSSLFSRTPGTSDDISRHSVGYLCVSYGPTRMVARRSAAISLRQPLGLVLAQFVFLPLYTCCSNFLRLANVQSPHTSIAFPCPCSFICRSGLLWRTVTHKTHALFCRWPGAHSIAQNPPSGLCTITHPRLLTTYRNYIELNGMS